LLARLSIAMRSEPRAVDEPGNCKAEAALWRGGSAAIVAAHAAALPIAVNIRRKAMNLVES